MFISGQEFSEQTITRINRVMEQNDSISRSALSRLICGWLKWRSSNGKLKEMSCRLALGVLEKKGLIHLNQNIPARPVKNSAKAKIKNSGISCQTISCEFSELGAIELIKVTKRDKTLSKFWNEIMDTYHYLGAGPLCGAQIRYLIYCQAKGYLGGLAFSAAAWRLGSRDSWIGWSEESRRKNLQLVVSNSRFLIVPSVKVTNLASHVLAHCAGRLRQDWMDIYGYEPVLLESFVEQGRFSGTSYQAANWIKVGETSGRGRQDKNHEKNIPIKDIYLYPLTKNPRKLLQVNNTTMDFGQPEQQRTYADWAEEEFGAVNIPDKRLRKRLLVLARDLYARPQANIPQACGTRAKTKAAYRFLENENTKMEILLEKHYESTINRISKEKVVLAVQDTTSFNYSAHPMTEGIGLIGSYENGPIGLLMHDTMVFNTTGTPLGLLDVQCWARDAAKFGTKNIRKNLPIEGKESNKWFLSFRKATLAQYKCPKTTVVSVGDRESDIYELFVEANKEKNNARLLVRAREDRRLAEQRQLWEKITEEPVSGILEIKLPRRPNQAERKASLEVKFSKVVLMPPTHKANLPCQELWAIQAFENTPVSGAENVQWMLLTNIPVNTFEQAVEKLRWYSIRWGIEVFHKTLKSGCKVEQRQLASADTITTCLAIDLVIAWRIFHLAKLGRETPNVPCTIYFAEEEWKALTAFITRNPALPTEAPSLRNAMRMVASLGGFLGRKNDGEPGTKTLWLGLQRLDDITMMWKCMMDIWQKRPVSSNPGYG